VGSSSRGAARGNQRPTARAARGRGSAARTRSGGGRRSPAQRRTRVATIQSGAGRNRKSIPQRIKEAVVNAANRVRRRNPNGA
jgi:hypothetical protein